MAISTSTALTGLCSQLATDVDAEPSSHALDSNVSSYNDSAMYPPNQSATDLRSSIPREEYMSGPAATTSASQSRRLLVNACLKLAALFLISTLLLGGTLYFALPTLERDDRQLLKVPTSFVELQALNSLLKKYRDIYPFRILICYIVVYLFLQAFSVPGSMYMSIIGGAIWGPLLALPLVCTLVAAGSSLCYLISAALGPALLLIPSLHKYLIRWSHFLTPEHTRAHTLTSAHTQNLFSLLIVLRISPFPPHWILNLLAPHLSIPLSLYFASAWLGILGVSVIHTTVGAGLDEMTSADDFHLLSWSNVLGLSALVIGALIPVALRYAFKKEMKAVVEVENLPVDEEEMEHLMLADGSSPVLPKQGEMAPFTLIDGDEDDRDTEVLFDAENGYQDRD